MGKILSINTRWYPVGGSRGMACAPVTAVLVAGVIEGGDIGDYAVYVGCGDKSHADDIALHGQKISYDEACAQFPIGLERNRYRP